MLTLGRLAPSPASSIPRVSPKLATLITNLVPHSPSLLSKRLCHCPLRTCTSTPDHNSKYPAACSAYLISLEYSFHSKRFPLSQCWAFRKLGHADKIPKSPGGQPPTKRPARAQLVPCCNPESRRSPSSLPTNFAAGMFTTGLHDHGTRSLGRCVPQGPEWPCQREVALWAQTSALGSFLLAFGTCRVARRR